MEEGDGEQPKQFQGYGSSGGEGFMGRCSCLLQETHGDGEEGRPSTRRHGVSIAHRGAMGICLPGGNDHGVFVGKYDRPFEYELHCQVFNSRLSIAPSNANYIRRAIRGQPLGLSRHARECLGVDRRLV